MSTSILFHNLGVTDFKYKINSYDKGELYFVIYHIPNTMEIFGMWG
jgi:hypothetical protein